MKTICRRGQGSPPPDNVVRGTEQGVALVITLLMLVVITTMAVAFLLLSQRETVAIGALHATTDAGNATEAATERAKADILAHFLPSPLDNRAFPANWTEATNEVMGPDFIVSLANTNWPDPLALDVGPPVIVSTNRPGTSAPLDNRFFLDLNRNAYFEETGPNVPDTDDRFATTGLQNARVGDPMWIGLKQDSKKPHGKDNYFIARYCYLIQPIGRSLDLNWIHNEAINRPNGGDIGYFRNQGIGPWELNLAAFLADVNASVWNTNAGPVSALTYDYSTNWINQQSVGDAFKDARWLLTNRLAGNKYNALSVLRLFGVKGEEEFGSSGMDSFSNGPLLPWGYESSFAGIANRFDNFPTDAGFDALKPWPGADSPRHYFTPQELFDTIKFPSPGGGQADFRDRLRYASNRGNSHDRYTFYRILSQLGTDSAPEKDDRIDLNYINVAGVPASALISWTNLAPTLSAEMTRAKLQFTNGFNDRYGFDGPEIFVNLVVERFLQEEGYGYTNRTYGRPFHIPVYTNVPALGRATAFYNGQPLYTPRLHQMVQMAANIFEGTTAQKSARDNDYPFYPTVFRPVFEEIGGEIFVSRFVLADKVVINDVVPGNAPLKWYDLNNSTNRPNNSAEWYSANFYDVPWVFGTRKGFPNFNEFNVQSQVSIKRFLQFKKTASSDGRITQTNQAFILGVKNYHFAEFANPYTNFYPRPLTAYMLNQMSVTVTNDTGFQWTTNWTTNNFAGVYAGNTWSNDYRLSITADMPSLPESIIVLPGTLLPLYPLTFDTAQRPYTNDWWVTVTNRVRCYLFDNNRLVDAFTSGQMNMTLELNRVLDRDINDSRVRLWDPKVAQRGATVIGNISQGVQNQIDICLSNINVASLNGKPWNDYAGFNPAQFSSIAALTAKFKAWCARSNTTDLEIIAPFNPSRTVIQAGSWQVNDPAVHSLVYDLYNPTVPNISSNRLETGETPDPANNKVLQEANASLGRRNASFYKPWAVDATAPSYAVAERDPMVLSPDSWQFPSQFAPAKYPNVGWLGRVHRGTPWQTIYMKADDPGYSATLSGPVQANAWRAHIGSSYMPTPPSSNNIAGPGYIAASTMFPTNDWRLLDIFTVAVHPNVTRGKLSINQTNLAAWSALFSGVNATTVGNANAFGQYEAKELTAQPLSVDAPTFTGNADDWTNAAINRLVGRINDYRSNLTAQPFPLGRAVAQFTKLSDLLAVDLLTTRSPFLTPPYISQDAENAKHGPNPDVLLTDADYERLPQQIAGLVKVGEPRYVIYAWGQSLKPAGNVPGLGFGIDASTKVPRNYQVTGEMATRAVVKIEYERDASGRPNRFRPRAVVESFNILPTD